MEALVAWFIASPIGEAIIGAVLKRIISQFTDEMTALKKQSDDNQAIIDQMKKDMEKMRQVTPTTPIADQEKAADDVLRHF